MIEVKIGSSAKSLFVIHSFIISMSYNGLDFNLDLDFGFEGGGCAGVLADVGIVFSVFVSTDVFPTSVLLDKPVWFVE